MNSFFNTPTPIKYEGKDSTNPLSFKYYDAKKKIMGKTMQEHLRFAVCYWHSFCWDGPDPFGGATMDRPWIVGSGDAMSRAKLKADTAFEMYDLLGVPFFTFHDRDIAPEGETLTESNRNVQEMADYFATKMEISGTSLLWGTANLFSNRRFMSGAATNPDPLVFAYAAAQVKNVLEVTHKLGGENYVLWGGREGYETLLNTDMKRELDQLGRFMNLVVEHKHKIGFKGTILIEPKPQEPTKHQYDFDTATVFGFLKNYGLEDEIKVNIEVGHAVLAGHSFEHEIQTANALGIFGSIDANRNDYQSGWDTDQFPNNVPEMSLALYYILKGCGFSTGGLNFDSKLRRQSIDPMDLIHGHIGGMDVCARALIAATKMLEDGALDAFVTDRYDGWNHPDAKKMLDGSYNLEDIAHWVEADNVNPSPKSGRQEYLENLVNRYL
jgi:xylose isomerase